MSQQLGAATPLTQADARTSPLNRAPRRALGVRRPAHARPQPRRRPVHRHWGWHQRTARFRLAGKPRHAPPSDVPQPRGQAPSPAPAPRTHHTAGPGGPRRGWGGAARARSGAARGWVGREGSGPGAYENWPLARAGPSALGRPGRTGLRIRRRRRRSSDVT